MIHSRSLQTMALAFCALAALLSTCSVVPLVDAKGTNKIVIRKNSRKASTGGMRNHSPNNGRNRSRHNFTPKHERADGHITGPHKKAGTDEFKRTNVFGEGSQSTRVLSGKGGKGGSKKDKNSGRNTDGFDTVESAVAVPTTSAALAVYDNKCEAAEAGAEFKTSSFVKLYYQYEVVTSSSRNILEVADIVDKAIQHFLAVWMVDCDTAAASDVADASTTNNAAGTTSATTTNVVGTTSATTTNVASPTSATTTNVAGSTATTNAATTAPVDLSSLSGFGTRRRLKSQMEQRQLQMSLVPIAGTGAGDYDTVLFGDSDAEKCSSLVASSLLGQVCYKVVGTVLVYIDETMQVTPQDVLTLALETLTVGMNYAATDFSQLDPDIYGLMLVQGYDEPPEDLLKENWEANKRPWDTTSIQNNPFKDDGRSGGAKFGIAFVTLLCIVVFLFICVYVFKNRERLFRDFDWGEVFCCCCTCHFGSNARDRRLNQNKHYSMDDSITLPSTIKSFDDNAPVARRVVQKMPVPTIRTFSSSPDSTGTKPLSPDPETPHYPTGAREQIIRVVQQQLQEEKEQQPKELDEDPTFIEQKNNIETPRSDWSVARSNVADLRDSDDLHDEESCMREPETPDDRIRIKLSKEAIRASYQKEYQRETPKPISTPRNYDCEDTVDL